MNSSGHFLMVITNSANTVGQPQRGCRDKALTSRPTYKVQRTLFSVRLGGLGAKPLLRRVSKYCSVSRLGLVWFGLVRLGAASVFSSEL